MDSIQHFPPLYRKTLSRHFKMFAILGYYIFNDSDKHFLIKYGRLIFFHCYFFVTVLFQVLYLFYGQRQGASLLEIIIAVPFSVLFIQGMLLLLFRTTLISYNIHMPMSDEISQPTIR